MALLTPGEELYVEDEMGHEQNHEVKNRLVLFDGRHLHGTRAFEGTRRAACWSGYQLPPAAFKEELTEEQSARRARWRMSPRRASGRAAEERAKELKRSVAGGRSPPSSGGPRPRCGQRKRSLWVRWERLMGVSAVAQLGAGEVSKAQPISCHPEPCLPWAHDLGGTIRLRSFSGRSACILLLSSSSCRTILAGFKLNFADFGLVLACFSSFSSQAHPYKTYPVQLGLAYLLLVGYGVRSIFVSLGLPASVGRPSWELRCWRGSWSCFRCMWR